MDELYDLEADPYELKNLAVLPEYNAKKQEMRKLLTERQERRRTRCGWNNCWAIHPRNRKGAERK